VARTQGAISPQRKAIRGVLDTLRQNLPDLMQGFVLAADPKFDWRVSGSVYQYTRFETLRSMLGGQIVNTPAAPGILSELWATSSLYMNDAKEFFRGREVIERELANLPGDGTTSRMKLALKDADALEVYCACFSGVDDDLSQWRGYGDNGAGVCIEFRLDDLLAELDGIGYSVIYGKPGDEGLQTSVARGLLSYIHSTISGSLPPPPLPGAVYDEIREQLTQIWPALFLAFKHLDFGAEKEFRFVYSEAVGPPLSPCFRPAPIVPFVRLRMGKGGRLPITSIRLGPAASSDANVRGLRLALDRLGLRTIQIQKSNIPYVPR
jgi:Protein of unknown function (DUF2971)